MISWTRMRGLSEAKGSWKMICISLRSDRSSSLSSVLKILALERDGAGRGLDQAQREPAERGFAAAALADQTDHFTGGHGQGNAVHGLGTADLPNPAFTGKVLKTLSM